MGKTAVLTDFDRGLTEKVDPYLHKDDSQIKTHQGSTNSLLETMKSLLYVTAYDEISNLLDSPLAALKWSCSRRVGQD